MIEFYFNLHCFHIQYNYCFRNYLPNYQKLSIIILFSLLKKIANIPNYFVFDCFLIFFFSLKRLLILLIVLPSIPFLSLKIFFTSLIIFSSLFLSFSSFFLFPRLEGCSLPLELCLSFSLGHFIVSIVPCL